MRIDSTFLLTLANIFDNLSAGWFGTAIIIPVSNASLSNINLIALTVDVVFGTLCFVIAYKLRKIGGKKHD